MLLSFLDKKETDVIKYSYSPMTFALVAALNAFF